MESTQARELAQQFIDALHALEQGTESEVAQIVALYADDAHLTNAALRLAGDERVGTDGIGRFWTDYKKTLGDAFSHFHQVTTSDQAAGLFWTTKGTANGQAVQYDGTSLLVFDEAGKIKYFQGYYDTRELSRAMGTEK